ncbi:MAG: DinB family protein [Chitinophagaceae bacterium]|nr:DinB family protein [Chitinophagaceae bacterium]
MQTATKGTQELFSSLDNTIAELEQIISSANEKDINVIPFENSWTAAQVVDHITKSMNGMADNLKKPGTITDREVDEKAAGFKTLFLNFESKMKSPPFVLPGHDVYDKNELVDALKNADKKLKDAAQAANLPELLNLPPIGELTKLELLHFVLYHTQRHIQQLKNILQKVNSKN